MPSCPPFTQIRLGQITLHAKMGVTYWLQKIFGNVVMQSSQAQAFCVAVLQLMEHSNSMVDFVFCYYILAFRAGLRYPFCASIPLLPGCLGFKNLQQDLL